LLSLSAASCPFGAIRNHTPTGQLFFQLDAMRFPHRIKKGRAVVTICRYRHRRKYWQFRLSYHLSGVRKLENFSKLERAKARAEEILRDINNGEIQRLTLTKDDLLVYTRAVKNIPPGTDLELDQIVLDWAEARAIAGGVPLKDIAKYHRAHQAGLKHSTVELVINEMIDAKRKQKKSDRHIEDLEYRLGAFKRWSPQMPIGHVSFETLRSFMESLEAKAKKKAAERSEPGRPKQAPAFSGRSHNNFIRALRSLCEWAIKQRYLAKDFDAHKQIETIEVGEEEIEYFQPQEMRLLLENASRPLDRVFLSIGAFAGVRTKEFLRLRWENFQFKGKNWCIRIPGKSAKTGARRVVPIADNLKAWIQPHAKLIGKVWPYSDAYLYERMHHVCETAGVRWKGNVLRHSFISYRLAKIQNIEQVAREAGNSPRMIEKHYDAAVSPDQADLWFGIVPPVLGNQLDFFARPEESESPEGTKPQKAEGQIHEASIT
jgi:integrase